MSCAATRPSRALAAAALVALAATLAAAGDENEDKAMLLTRSIYLPVQFATCEHLHDAVLYMGERPVAVLPSKRIFQFTYYPHLGRVEPLRTDVRVEGARDDGSEFLGRMAVTPWGIFTASSRVELDLDAQLQKMRYKLDVRYETFVLRLRCDEACERRDTPTAVIAASPEDGR